jgi:signal transduction histidine kinase
VSDAPDALIQLADHSDLPPIWGDHDRLEQVFVNLLDNAVRHAPGLTQLSVVARLDSSADTVTVRISDDGVGIPADVAERVFLPHERGMTTAPGAGLGLAIARGIVDAHRGSHRLERVPVGTTVSVTLPVEPAGASDDRDVDREAAGVAAAPGGP